MTTRRLLLDSLRHYWRTHLGVILGSALAALVLTGALMVGDSVKATLRAQAGARVGKIGEALLCGERFVPWPHELEKRPSLVARSFLPGPDAAGVLILSGTAARTDGKARANKVQIVGADDAFWKLSPSGKNPFADGGKKTVMHDPGGAVKSSPNADTKLANTDGAQSSVDVASGSAGVPPAVPGIPPRTSDVANAQHRDMPRANERLATSGVGRGTRPTAGGTPALPDATSIALNERLAAQLGVQPGDEVLLRLEKPSAFSKDAPLSGEDEGSVTLRARVARTVGDADFGRFALTNGQVPPHTAFVPLAALQEKLGVGEKVNALFEHDKNAGGDATPVSSVIRGIRNPPRSDAASNPDDLALIDSLLARRDAFAAAPRMFEQYDLRAVELPNTSGIELRSPRIFLESAIVEAARANESGSAGVPPAVPGISPGTPNVEKAPQREKSPANEPKATPALPRGLDSLTYFVNELRAGDGSDAKANATPYSMVTAIDAAASGFVNPKLADGEIQITRWLADDLGVAPGGKVTVKYFVMGERRQLVEKARTFTVAAPILEMTEPQLNASWMPDFPGLADKANCRDWKPGFDFDATRMRDKDQDYWTKFRGTPKAFVTLKTGQELWGNRWGNLTSIRYPAGTKREQVERIAAFIDPAALGFRTVNLREQALAATNAPVDFGELFVYFSFFLIAAAAVLTGLLFTFTIEQRAAEAGLLLATGWPVKKVRRLFLREGFVLALIGSLAGALLAALYTQGVLHALAGVWGGATGGTRFVFAPSVGTMAIGVVSGVFVALIAMWLASRRLFKMEAAALLSGVDIEKAGTHDQSSNTQRASGGRLATIAAACVVGAIALAVFAKGNSGAFFGAGALLLIAGCLFALARLRSVAEGTGAESITQLGARNISRRRGRSLATIAVLASGVFMVIAVDSFRKGAPEDSLRRDSGTGGFAFIGESSAPIYEDLNSAKGRDAYALDDKLMSGVRVVQMRVRDGDDASCLNLNRAMQPRLLGLNFSELENVGAAGMRASGSAGVPPAVPGVSPGTSNVAQPPQRDTPAANERTSTSDVGRGTRPTAGGTPALPETDRTARRGNRFGLDWPAVKAEGAIPAVVDANTLQWALQKKLGDVLEYAGERGEPVRVKFAATVNGSILQGVVIIHEHDFVANFPNVAGYRFFLVDCPREKMDAVREHLTRQLGDRGLELTPAVKRLAEFNEVENTYLSIFQVLGGLGMLLGSAGLGIVVARNVFERRREFGLLEAVGFTPRLLRRLVFAEHRWLIIGALSIGTVSAITAVWPRLSAQAAHFPWRGIFTLLAGMALLGAFWAWFATRVALRHSQLSALRNE